jgi:hypothetical protein
MAFDGELVAPELIYDVPLFPLGELALVPRGKVVVDAPVLARAQRELIRLSAPPTSFLTVHGDIS